MLGICNNVPSQPGTLNLHVLIFFLISEIFFLSNSNIFEHLGDSGLRKTCLQQSDHRMLLIIFRIPKVFTIDCIFFVIIVKTSSLANTLHYKSQRMCSHISCISKSSQRESWSNADKFMATGTRDRLKYNCASIGWKFLKQLRLHFFFDVLFFHTHP